MPASNEFVSFATGGGAYVLSPAAYAGLAARLTGYGPGLLLKENLNTAIRQAAFMGVALAQFAADQSGNNSLDNGNVAMMEGNIILAIINTVANAGFGAKKYIKANTTLAAGPYLVDTLTPAAPLTLQMPLIVAGQNPAIQLEDAANSWDAYPVTLNGNGQLFDDGSATYVLDSPNQQITFVFYNGFWEAR